MKGGRVELKTVPKPNSLTRGKKFLKIVDTIYGEASYLSAINTILSYVINALKILFIFTHLIDNQQLLPI